MKTLVVDKEADELRYRSRSILIYQAGKQVASVPVSQIERVVVSPAITLTAGVLGVLVEADIPLCVFNSRYPKRLAYLSGAGITDVARRVEQYKLVVDQQQKFDLSLWLVRHKMLHQLQFLNQLIRRRSDIRKPIFDAVKTIRSSYINLTTNPVANSASLRGVEGAAAARYFAAFTQVFPPGFQFSGRHRRPPTDPVNALLSLSNTLVYYEAVAAIKMVGLDPAMGFYHDLYYGRASLACDVMEGVRTDVERWVWRLCADRIIRVDHFSYDGQMCMLTKAAKAHFYSEYMQKAACWRKRLKRYVRLFVRHLATREQVV